MARKKWTPKIEVTDADIKFREKRKWQLSYRRYVLEKKPSTAYAYYFGLDIEKLRKWFELQFTEEINWENYANAWQFDHIIPITYFDFSDKEDLRLCWSYINMRIEKITTNKKSGNKLDVLAVTRYFEEIYQKTGLILAKDMVSKIATLQISNTESNYGIETFIINNKPYLENIQTLAPSDFNRLNEGIPLQDLLLEREMMRKFG